MDGGGTPDAGSGCERFHFVASGTACDSCSIDCYCATGAFPISLASCTPDGCVIAAQCPAICDDKSGATKCSGTYTVTHPCLQAHAPVGIGTDPSKIAVDDLNGDKALDAVVFNQADRSLSVVLGDGGLTAIAPVPTGALLEGLATGDFRGTGNKDVVSCDYGAGAVALFGNDGSGKLTQQGSFAACEYAQDISAGDFDGDGKPDVAVACNSTGIAVLRNNGAGGFETPMFVPAGTEFHNVQYLVAGDINADGLADIVAGHPDGGLGIFLARPGGALAPEQLLSSGEVFGLALGDANGDGVLDVVATGGADTSMHVFYGSGGCTFSGPGVYMAGHIPGDIKLADMNGDQHPDAVTIANGAVVVTLNTGDGAFGTQLSTAVGQIGRWLAVGDFDGDSKPDVLAETGSPDASGALVLLTNACQ